jgi:acyl-CoA reductase-like NAD-dependent aldehyde dehydrogenase
VFLLLQNSGQNCVGIERIYVYESVFDQFVDKAAAAVRNLRVGSPVDSVTGNAAQVDMGPITTAPQLELIQALVDDAVNKGAHLLVGGYAYFQSPEAASKAPKAIRGKSPARGRGAGAVPESDGIEVATPSNPLAQGLFYAPTVLAGVTHDMRIANEEVFGPVMSIFKVPNNNDEAVIAMANATQYGLGATVYSGSPARANRIAARLHCGMVGVNAYGLNYLVQSLPFGGVGASGFDRFGGPEGLRACCLMRSVVTDWLSWLSIPTPVPKQLQYPVAADAPAFTHALIQMQFADSWVGKLKGLLGLAGLR